MKTLISIIIPSRNSSIHLKTLLESIKKQNFTGVETILVDNYSSDGTLEIANEYKVRVVKCSGKAPQVAKQRNIGAMKAHGEYLYFMDHDMELSSGFLEYFAALVEKMKNKSIDAWYVPEKIIAKSYVLSTVRNFEGDFINGTIISAARIIKNKSFLRVRGYEKKLSGGPADWDLDIQLKLAEMKFAILNKVVYHHEEKLSVWSYIFKKTTYIEGEEIYKKKWRSNIDIYKNIVVKQYSLRYRIFWIFVERGKWRKLLGRLHEYFLFLIIKLTLVVVYVYWKKRYVR